MRLSARSHVPFGQQIVDLSSPVDKLSQVFESWPLAGRVAPKMSDRFFGGPILERGLSPSSAHSLEM